MPLKLGGPVFAAREALVADGYAARRALLVAAAGAVAALVQPARADPLALPLAPHVGVVAACYKGAGVH